MQQCGQSFVYETETPEKCALQQHGARYRDMRAEELTKLCAAAMGYAERDDSDDEFIDGIPPPGLCVIDKDAPPIRSMFYYDPLHNGGQCFELVERFNININRDHYMEELLWAAEFYDRGTARIWEVMHPRLSRAICECVAQMQAARSHATEVVGNS